MVAQSPTCRYLPFAMASPSSIVFIVPQGLVTDWAAAGSGGSAGWRGRYLPIRTPTTSQAAPIQKVMYPSRCMSSQTDRLTALANCRPNSSLASAISGKFAGCFARRTFELMVMDPSWISESATSPTAFIAWCDTAYPRGPAATARNIMSDPRAMQNHLVMGIARGYRHAWSKVAARLIRKLPAPTRRKAPERTCDPEPGRCPRRTPSCSPARIILRAS